MKRRMKNKERETEERREEKFSKARIALVRAVFEQVRLWRQVEGNSWDFQNVILLYFFNKNKELRI